MTATSIEKKRGPKLLADFFVSYSSSDLRTARQFVDWITKAGMATHIIEPGEGSGKSFPAAMGEAIERCDRLLAVYTQHYKNSGACTAEMEGMWRRNPDGKLGRILIVRLDATEVPALFATRDYWDFTKIPVENVKEEFLRRLQALKPIRPPEKVTHQTQHHHQPGDTRHGKISSPRHEPECLRHRPPSETSRPRHPRNSLPHPQSSQSHPPAPGR